MAVLVVEDFVQRRVCWAPCVLDRDSRGAHGQHRPRPLRPCPLAPEGPRPHARPHRQARPRRPRAAPDVSDPAGIQATAGTAVGYVGSDTCTACHTEAESLKRTQHGQAKNPRSPEATLGCESCHGPGQAHVDDDAKGHIRKFDEITSAEINQTVSHVPQPRRKRRLGSEHARTAESACTTCHSVHSPKSTERQLVKVNEDQLCATCHRLQVTKTERSVAHMPVREDKMSCSSCHNPHGSLTNVKALKVGNSVSETCKSCHAEKRAPVLWEHAPVSENCTTCHDPHGSSNDRMLAVRMPMLCQRCHVATSHPSSTLR